MQFNLKTPGLRIQYGFDRTAIGFFCTVVISGRSRVYDGLHHGYDHERPLLGLLRFLVACGAFSEADLHDALALAEDGGAARSGSPAALALEILSNLKRAAD